MKFYSLIICLAFLFFACTSNTKKPPLTDQKTTKMLDKSVATQDSFFVVRSDQWLKGEGLNRPECVVFDTINQVFYVSNGKDYQVSNDGFISKISIEGDLLDLKWVKNLNRPTGMAVHNKRLYVADVNVVLVIDTQSGSVLQRFSEPIDNSGLNDIAVSTSGQVFVTASFIHAVFKTEGAQLVQWVKDEEKLKWANGLLIERDRLLVAGLDLNAIDLRTKEITSVYKDVEIMDFDGLATDGKGGYFLTTVGKSALWHLSAQNKAQKVSSGKDYFGDLATITERNYIYIPRGNISTEEFFLSVHSLKD